MRRSGTLAAWFRDGCPASVPCDRSSGRFPHGSGRADRGQLRSNARHGRKPAQEAPARQIRAEGTPAGQMSIQNGKPFRASILRRSPVMTGTAAGADPSGGCAGAILIRTGAPMGGQLRGCRTDQDAQRLPASGNAGALISDKGPAPGTF